jgi:hypothetical protein
MVNTLSPYVKISKNITTSHKGMEIAKVDVNSGVKSLMAKQVEIKLEIIHSVCVSGLCS